jgi:hypothetical protein
MPRFESNPFGVTNEQRIADTEREASHLEYTLLNSAGEKICDVKMELKNGHVTSYFLLGEKDRVPTRVNLLAMTGITSDQNVKIKLTNERGGEYSPIKHELTIPSPTHSVNVVVALHEFGHFRQFKEEAYVQLDKLDLEKSTTKGKLEFLKAIYEFIPETQSTEFFETLEQVSGLVEQAEALLAEEREFLETKILPLENQHRDALHHLLRSHVPLKQEEVFNMLEHIRDAPSTDQPDQAYAAWETLTENGIEFDGAFSFEDLLDETVSRHILEALSVTTIEPNQIENFVIDHFNTLQMSFNGKRGSVTMRIRLKNPAILQHEITKLDEEYPPKIQAFTQDFTTHKLDRRLDLEKHIHASLDHYFSTYKDLPRKIFERDATFRALQWMKKIRKETGIDLFQATTVGLKQSSLSLLFEQEEKGKTVPWDLGELFSNLCGTAQPVGDPETVTITPQGNLKAGLASYDGLGAQLRQIPSTQNPKNRVPRIRKNTEN